MKGRLKIIDKSYHVLGKLKVGVVVDLAHISWRFTKFDKDVMLVKVRIE